MNKKTIITLVVCLLAVAGSVYFLFWYKGKAVTSDTIGTDTGTGTGTGTTTVKTNVFPLQKGSNGTEVKNLQRKMNEWMNFNWFSVQNKPANSQLVVDGIFGSKTLAFVQIIFSADTVSESDYNNLLNETFNTASAAIPEKPFWQVW